MLVCRPTGRADEEPCARTILATLARRAYRRPVAEDGRRDAAVVLQDRTPRRQLRRGYRARARAPAGRPGVSVPHRARSVDRHAWHRLSRQRRRACVAAVVLPLEQHPGRRTAGAGGARPAERSRPCSNSRSGGCSPMPAPSSLVTNFAAQWLHLRNLRRRGSRPGAVSLFRREPAGGVPEGDGALLREHAARGSQRPRSAGADYTFVNERLARHYGIPGIYGSHFRRVRLPDANRGGLLGHGSILTVTSYSNRTSPVVRGKWVLDNILGTPPPPPPPNVPALNERDDQRTGRSRCARRWSSIGRIRCARAVTG